MSIKTTSFSRVGLALALTLASGLSMAQAFDAVRLNAAAPGKDGGYIGAGVIAGTKYQGSDERRTAYLPVVEYQWASGWFAGVGNGVGFNFSKDSSLQYGVRLTMDLGRDESRSTALRGMGDIEARAEVGGFLNYNLVPGLMLTSSLRTGSGKDRNGSLFDLGLGYSTRLDERWRLSAGAALTWANDAYMQDYFGVTSAQSATSAYSVYTPGAALRDARLRLALSYRWDARLSLTTALAYSSLSDAARRSPLVRQDETVSAVMVLAYAF